MMLQQLNLIKFGKSIMNGEVRERKHLCNVDQSLQDYMTQHPRRQSSSYLPLWEG
jgi:hypothetical protein